MKGCVWVDIKMLSILSHFLLKVTSKLSQKLDGFLMFFFKVAQSVLDQMTLKLSFGTQKRVHFWPRITCTNWGFCKWFLSTNQDFYPCQLTNWSCGTLQFPLERLRGIRALMLRIFVGHVQVTLFASNWVRFGNFWQLPQLIISLQFGD